MKRVETRLVGAQIDSETGEFSGYGSVFGNVDSHGDVITRGAFTKTLQAWNRRGRLPTMLLMHGSNGNPFTGCDLPAGIWTEMREDSNGLFVRGRVLALNTEYGRRILSLMQGGALDGLSVGFRVRNFRPGKGSIKRWIDEIQLFEISLVDQPSNDLARVTPTSGLPMKASTDEAYDRLRKALAGLSQNKTEPAAAGSDTVALLASMRAATAEMRAR